MRFGVRLGVVCAVDVVGEAAFVVVVVFIGGLLSRFSLLISARIQNARLNSKVNRNRNS